MNQKPDKNPGKENRLVEYNKVLEMIALDHSFQEVLDNLVLFTQRQSSGLVCSILLMDDTGTKLLNGSAPDLPEEYNKAVHGIKIGPMEGSCGTAAYLNKIVIVKDIATDPLWEKYKECALKHGLRSCWSSPIRDSKGKALGTFAIYHKSVMEPGQEELDLITFAAHFAGLAIERKRNENEIFNKNELLLKKENYLSKILNHMLDGLITINSQGIIQYINPISGKIFGYQAGELIGQNVSTLMAEPYRSEHDQYLENYSSTRVPKIIGIGREVLGLRKNGEEFPLELAVSEVRLEDETIFIGILRDLTAKKEVEKKLHFVESIVKNAGDAAFCLHLDTAQFIYVNSMACKSLGYSSSELLEMRVFDIDPEYQADFWPQFREELQKHKTLSFESHHQTKTGDIFPVEITTHLMEFDGIKYSIAFARNIVERKKNEAELVKTKDSAEKANSSKTEFLSKMSHELRTPMNAILGFGQLLRLNSKVTLDSDLKNSVDQILAGGNHLLNLINEILDFARIESGENVINFQNVDLEMTTSNVLEMLLPLSQTKGIQITWNNSQKGLWVKADPLRLKQVLFNLISNGIKYNKDEGDIHIHLERLSSDRIQTKILDTGIGIPQDKLDFIFEPFSRLNIGNINTEGTGIGLSVTKSLLESMEGSVSAESTLGKGSCFIFELPAGEKAVPPETIEHAQEETSFPPIKRKPKSVLYIEDNIINQDLVQNILSTQPHLIVICASNAVEGIALAVAHQPDLILMDIELPDIDGISAFKQLKSREETKHIPVIAVSACALASKINEALQAGFNDYITKPIDISKFIDTLNLTLT